MDRWNACDWYDPDPAAPGKTVAEAGDFLDRIDMFDAGFFGILPREADRMDPQQRLTLEVAMEAIDDAGLPHSRLHGSRTLRLYRELPQRLRPTAISDPDNIDARTLTGALHCVVPNRLSYLLDLRGPSVSIDTGCSSSLVAIHLGCQSLRSGETDLAIAGGVSLMMAPELSVAMSKVGFMAPDGRCKTFDASADGFGRGEGCGIVVLKRLSDAIADDDRIHAVIRGSAVNQDGRSTLLAAPNGPAQEALIRESLRSAQLAAGRICFFETHGTGTALGDPIEVEAIATAVGRSEESEAACWLGSAKANFGHLEAAAGVVGLIKTIQVLRHGAVPPQPYFTKLNPHISLAGTRLAIPTALTRLPETGLPRCAAVSSFGVGGTNANLIVEEAPKLPTALGASATDARRILPLSSQSPAALAALVASWTRFLTESPASIDDLCHTAGNRRTHYDCRVAVTGASKDELRSRLEALSVADSPPGHHAAASQASRVGFVFCGQGPQWFAMGRELLAADSRFREVVAACDALLRPLAGWSLLEELSLPEERSRLAETEIAQPALFAIQVGLAALWKSWGVSPDCVVGHSLGEIAALHTAGALDLAEAIRIVFHRGRIMQKATGNGRMAAVGLSEKEAVDVVAPYGVRLGVGAVNGPRSVVLSGEAAALDEVLAGLQRRDVSCRILPVNYAFHSAQMAPLRDALVSELGDVRASEPQMPFISTVTGVRETGRLDANYFGRNVREPVRFAAAATEMLQDCGLLIEIGPHPVLGAAIADCAASQPSSPLVLASLRRGRPERETMLQACAEVYAAGRDVNWKEIQAGPGRIVDLPAYPWQRRRHWIPVRQGRGSRSAGADHPLLGRRTEVAGLDVSLYQSDSASVPDWLSDHRIGGRVLAPAAAEMEAFCAAGSRFLGAPVEIVDFAIHRPLAMPQDGDALVNWQVVVKKTDGGRADLEWHASEAAADSAAGNWRSIATAIAQPVGGLPARPSDPATTVAAPIDSVYTQYAELGAQFGPALRCLRQIERADGFARASIELSGSDPIDPYGMHPALIDAALQLCLVAIGGEAGQVLPQSLYLPLGADRILINAGPHQSLVARTRIRKAADEAVLVADIWVDAPSGEWAMIVEGMRFGRAEPLLRAQAHAGESLYRVDWAPIANLSTPGADVSGTWLIFADNGGAAVGLAERLRQAGARVAIATRGCPYRRVSADEFVVDPAAPGDIRRVFQEGGWEDANRLRAVVDCWPLDIPKGEDHLGGGEPEADLLATRTALHLVQAIAATSALASGSLILATRGGAAVSEAGISGDLSPRAAGLWGLAGAIAIEHPDIGARIIDLDPQDTLDESAVLYAECVHGSDARVAYRDRRRWTPRLRPYFESGVAAGDEPIGVALTQPGVFDGVDLRPRARERLRDGEVRLKVLAAGLNFRDVLLALGLYPGSGAPVGAECAGVVIETGTNVVALAVGDLVFGYAPGSLATEAVAQARMLAPVPPGMAATTAASLPIAFLTALYGLRRVANLKKGQSVLIHAAAGGVGLAAVRIAQQQGAEIFATAGSVDKRQLLIRQGVRHVMNSRSLEFADQILALTQNRGVDVVLNSLAGDFIPTSLRSLAKGGCFLELGKRDIWSPEAVAAQRPDVRYAAYDLGEEIERDPNLFGDLMNELAAVWPRGAPPPLPVTLFPLERARDAMRFMAQARHVGKIVLTTKAGRADPAPALVRDGTYWITGGLGGAGQGNCAVAGASRRSPSRSHGSPCRSGGGRRFRSRAVGIRRHLSS